MGRFDDIEYDPSSDADYGYGDPRMTGGLWDGDRDEWGMNGWYDEEGNYHSYNDDLVEEEDYRISPELWRTFLESQRANPTLPVLGGIIGGGMLMSPKWRY